MSFKSDIEKKAEARKLNNEADAENKSNKYPRTRRQTVSFLQNRLKFHIKSVESQVHLAIAASNSLLSDLVSLGCLDSLSYESISPEFEEVLEDNIKLRDELYHLEDSLKKVKLYLAEHTNTNFKAHRKLISADKNYAVSELRSDLSFTCDKSNVRIVRIDRRSE